MHENGWLLLLYSLPTKRGSARVGIWRQLKKSGALPLKTSAYLLPQQVELMERFQWLAQQVRDAGGEATLAHVSEVEGLSQGEIIQQFHDARAIEYTELIAPLNTLIARHRKKADDTLAPDLEKLRRQFEEVRRIDFLECPRAHDVEMLLARAASLVAKPTRTKTAETLSVRRYTAKTWLTRPRPEIDRVGSAWLILRFIDRKARFVFHTDPNKNPGAIPYDMTGVEFSHHDDDCTFETLLKRFGLTDKPLKRIAEMIHDTDLEDGKFQTVEAFGIDRVFKGWGRLGLCDEEILSRGFQCFDALYKYIKDKI